MLISLHKRYLLSSFHRCGVLRRCYPLGSVQPWNREKSREACFHSLVSFSALFSSSSRLTSFTDRPTSLATGAGTSCDTECSATHEDNERHERGNNILFHRIAQELAMLRQTRVTDKQLVKSTTKEQQNEGEEKERGDEKWKRAMALFQNLPWNVEIREKSSGIAADRWKNQTAQMTVLLEHLLFTLFRTQAPATICHSVYLMCRSLKMPTTSNYFSHAKELPTLWLRSPFYTKGLHFHYASYLYQQSARCAFLDNIHQAIFYLLRCLLVLVVDAPLDHNPRSLTPSAMILGLQALVDWERYKWNLEGAMPESGPTTPSTASSPASRSREETEAQTGKTVVQKEPDGEEAIFNQWLLEIYSADKHHQEKSIPKRSDVLESFTHASSFDTETPSLRNGVSFPFAFSSEAPVNAVVLAWSMLYQVCTFPSTSASSLLHAIRLFLSAPFCFSEHPLRRKSVREGNMQFPLPPLAWHCSASSLSNDHEEDDTGRCDNHTLKRTHSGSKRRTSKRTLKGSRSYTPLWCVTDPSTSPSIWHRLIATWNEALWGGDASLAISSSFRVIEFLRFLNDEWVTTDLIPGRFSFSSSNGTPQRRDGSIPVSGAFRCHLQRAMFLVLEFPSSPDGMWRAFHTTSPSVSEMTNLHRNFPFSNSSDEKEGHMYCSLLGWFAHLLLESLALIRGVEGTQSARWSAHSQLVSKTLKDILFFVKKKTKTHRESSCVRCSPREAEQELWSLVFDGVRRGLFCLDQRVEEKQGAYIEKEVPTKSNLHATKDPTNVTSLSRHALSSSFSSLTGSIPMLLSWIIPLYDDSQWQSPTVNAYMAILDDWKQSKLMGEVFHAIQRREWRALKATKEIFTQSGMLSSEMPSERGVSTGNAILRLKEEKFDEADAIKDGFSAEMKAKKTSLLNNKEKALLAVVQLYVPSLSLPSCALVIQHCCHPARHSKGGEMGDHFHQDPFLAEEVVKYMMLQLLLQQNQKEISSFFVSARFENTKGAAKNGVLSSNDAYRIHSCSQHQNTYDADDCLRWRSWIEHAALPMIVQSGKRS